MQWSFEAEHTSVYLNYSDWLSASSGCCACLLSARNMWGISPYCQAPENCQAPLLGESKVSACNLGNLKQVENCCVVIYFSVCLAHPVWKVLVLASTLEDRNLIWPEFWSRSMHHLLLKSTHEKHGSIVSLHNQLTFDHKKRKQPTEWRGLKDKYL